MTRSTERHDAASATPSSPVMPDTIYDLLLEADVLSDAGAALVDMTLEQALSVATATAAGACGAAGGAVLDAAAASDCRTMHGLALLAFEEDDWDLARHWWSQAAAGGHVRAMVALAVIAEADGDVETARSWWQQAAHAGDPDAMYSMGLLAEVSGDWDSARAWWRRAADATLSFAPAALPAA